jgi:four helix bundle protein
MHITKFEDIVAWQKSQELAVVLYVSLKDCKDFSFKDQILRAVVSISNNIAEGFDRDTDKELIRFLYIAKGSSAEVRSMLYLAKNLEYLEENTLNSAMLLTQEISKMLYGFIAKLQAMNSNL